MGDFTFYAYMEPSYSATMMASYVEAAEQKRLRLDLFGEQQRRTYPFFHPLNLFLFLSSLDIPSQLFVHPMHCL